MLRLKSNYYKIFMRLNGIRYGRNVNLIGLPFIFKEKNAKLVIGNNCTIKSDFLSNLIGLFQRTIIIARGSGEVLIGDNVGMSGVTIYARDRIVIGNNTNIGGNVKILDNDFHPVDPVGRLENDQSLIGHKEIIIKENVFIGCNSIILKGSVLGVNCVVGAGSVVCGQFPDNVVVAGNPAKIIKAID